MSAFFIEEMALVASCVIIMRMRKVRWYITRIRTQYTYASSRVATPSRFEEVWLSETIIMPCGPAIYQVVGSGTSRGTYTGIDCNVDVCVRAPIPLAKIDG